MENIQCIICSRNSSFHYLKLSDRLSTTSKEFNLVKCTCGFIYLNPRPTNAAMSQHYRTENYDPHEMSSTGIWNIIYRFIQRITFRWKYRIMRHYIKSGSILDIGGGNGEFAEYVHGKGWIVTMQDSFLDVARENISSTFISELSELNLSEKFNVITLWHSLEHIHKINKLFNSLDNLLQDSGIIMIAVPNLNAPERKFYKQLWAPYDAPRHLYHFNFYQLNKLCRQKGYDIIQKYSMYQDLPYNVLLSMPNYFPLQIIKAIFVICYSFLFTLFAGPKFASSLLIVCRKKT